MAAGDRKGGLSGSGSSTPNPCSATGSVSVAVGDLIWVTIGHRGSLVDDTVSDNLGHSYTAQNAGSDAGNATGRAYWVIATNAGTLTQVDVAVTATSNDDFSVAVDVYEGPYDGTPLDASPTNVTNDITTPFASPSSGTLAQADELVISWITATNGRDMSVNSPFTLGQTVKSGSEGGANTVCAAIARQVVSATTPVSCEWTAGGAPGADVIGLASFKLSTGAKQGAASFSGAGSVSARGNQGMIAAASLSGAGSLSARAAQNHLIEARFAGAGALSAEGQLPTALRAVVSWIELNSGVSEGAVAHSAEARFAGAGALSVLANEVGVIEARFGGVGGLSIAGLLNQIAQIAFAGAGDLSADTGKTKNAEAIFSGLGVLSVFGNMQNLAAVSYGGVGSFSILAAAGRSASAIFDGAGTLSIPAGLSGSMLALCAGAGTLSALANLNEIAQATFNGLGTLRVDATVTGQVTAWEAQAQFNGAGGLSVRAQLNQRAAAQLAGGGTLSVNGRVQNRAAASFVGQGLMSAAAQLSLRAASRFQGAGSFSIDVQTTIKEISARFGGAGLMSTALRQNNLASAVFDGASTMSARARVGYSAEIRFTGTGSMLITARSGVAARARFEGMGTMSSFVQSTAGDHFEIGAMLHGLGGMSVNMQQVSAPPPEPVYDYPIGRSLDSDYGIRRSKLGRRRYIIGRR